MMETLVSEKIVCRSCNYQFGSDEARVCRQCHSHICPECLKCLCLKQINYNNNDAFPNLVFN